MTPASPHLDLIDPLLPELIALQRRDRCLLPEAMKDLADRLQVPLNRVYSVASFYQAFRFTPCGKHQIKVCVGAACYVKGAEHVYEAFRKHLNIPDDGDTFALLTALPPGGPTVLGEPCTRCEPPETATTRPLASPAILITTVASSTASIASM